ncbi:hypothetical protein ALC53_09551, partial [Atta colombica]
RWNVLNEEKQCNNAFLCITNMHFETVDRCMAKANSSESKNPSLLMSESFQIFPSTLFGNLDLTISDLAASNIK